MFSGLSAFPLTPVVDEHLGESAFAELISSLAAAGVDSITALGSTGSAAYLTVGQRHRAAEIAVDSAGTTPVLIGVSAVATREVLGHVSAAEDAGAAGVLLAPLSYQPLTDEEVFGLFDRVSQETELPIVVYDNPTTTGFVFTDELLARIAALPRVASIKMPGVPVGTQAARDRVTELRRLIPDTVTLGVSGDWMAVRGLRAGCDAWHSVLAGVLPGACLAVIRAAQDGDEATAQDRFDALAPIWSLFQRLGSYRTVSAIADELGLIRPESLHHPVRPLAGADRAAVISALAAVEGRG
ncbi:dihydrodipicolinate synthase family protein [Leucobacter sp. M11]|uniref:dihydrodipicolinate synthase family protein n=1 Tax=Leucobacter sp. M11 TaxID=2993565 RepID=UPI002D8105EA|nr:dihydrodipicolinate synthase family protein [Leucobacter sp. M11]MEB4613159.1 dihydrodipicolinate synthase family protein [Leucobacter sp. M11]